MVQASPISTPEKWISLSSPIMISSISLQLPSFSLSGLSKVDAISPPAYSPAVNLLPMCDELQSLAGPRFFQEQSSIQKGLTQGWRDTPCPTMTRNHTQLMDACTQHMACHSACLQSQAPYCHLLCAICFISNQQNGLYALNQTAYSTVSAT